jgi:N-methylhydantoinase B
VSAECAHTQYGVVLVDGRVDDAGTEALRASLRGARIGLESLPAPSAVSSRADRRMLSENVMISDSGAATCLRCSTELARGQNFRAGAVVTGIDLLAYGLVWVDPRTYVDDEIVLRAYCCPGCGTQLDTELGRAGDPILIDRHLS